MTGAGPNKASRNEQIKLMASLLNTLAGATITVGVLAPVAGVIYGVSTPVRSAGEMALVVLVWLLTGVALHVSARVLPAEDRGMTGLQFYALYGAPFVMLAAGLAVIGVNKLLDRWEQRGVRPGQDAS